MRVGAGWEVNELMVTLPYFEIYIYNSPEEWAYIPANSHYPRIISILSLDTRLEVALLIISN